MKRAIFLALVFVICLSLSACGGHPLSKDFQTEDELVVALEEYFSDENWSGLSSEKQDKKLTECMEALSSNTAIHHYFQKSDAAIQLAHRLYKAIGQYHTLDVFDACNTDDWYIGIANTFEDSDGLPLFFSGWYYDRPTCVSIADDIRDEGFIDPLSVSVLGGVIGFVDPVDGYFSLPFSYRGVIEVRATNRLGAYITQEYVITGSFADGDVRIIKEYDRPDYEKLDLLEEMGAGSISGGFFVLS